jgi:hypothetical protein
MLQLQEVRVVVVFINKLLEDQVLLGKVMLVAADIHQYIIHQVVVAEQAQLAHHMLIALRRVLVV